MLAGLLTFVLLRAFVARWPKVGPIFLLGPVVSLGLWSGQDSAPALAPVAPPLPAAARRPDIALIVLDTVRAQALSSYGHSRNTMPNLERFARGSTTFRRAWTDASWTLPAHASLVSGARPTRHRYDSGFDPFERSSPDRFLAARLRRAGYATAAVTANFRVFGKDDPLLRGFERVDAEPLRPFAFQPWFFDFIDRFGHRASLDEEATRIPLIIRGPGLSAGAIRDTPVQLLDVFGYLARAGGVAVEPGLDWRNFSERRAVVIEHRPGAQGELPASYPRGDLSALIVWPFKYVEGPGVAAALFDLEQDQAELVNLAAQEPAQAKAMSLLLRELSGSRSSPNAAPDPATEGRLRALGYVR